MNIVRTRPATLGTLTAILATLACASAPTAPAPAPAAVPMAYGASAATMVRYVITDSTTFDAQMVRTEIATRAVVDLRLQPEADGSARVLARVSDFAGTFANRTTGGTMTADEAGAAGEFSFRVDPRGHVTEFTRPALSPEFQQVGRGGEFLRTPFIRVPGTVVARGSAWTDTLTAAEESDGVLTRTNTVVTSTWTGDSIVAGRTLRLIESAAHTTVEVSGEIQGTAMRQRLEGSSTARSLWDPARRLVVWRRSTGQLQGAMELPQIGSLPVTVKLASTAELAPGN